MQIGKYWYLKIHNMEKVLNVTMAILMAAVCLAATFFAARSLWQGEILMAVLMAGIAIISGWLAAEQPNDDD